MEIVLPWEAHSDPLSINLCAQINSDSTLNRLILKSFLHRVRDPASPESESMGIRGAPRLLAGILACTVADNPKSDQKVSGRTAPELQCWALTWPLTAQVLYLWTECFIIAVIILIVLSTYGQWTWMHKIQEKGAVFSDPPSDLNREGPEDLYPYGSCSRVFSSSYNSLLTSFMSFAKCQHFLPHLRGSGSGQLCPSSSLFWFTAVFDTWHLSTCFFSLPLPHTDHKLQNRGHCTFGLLLFSLHLECAQSTAVVQ